MRYWITVHYPHPVDDALDVPWFVFLKKQYRNRGESLAPGDPILFYETASRTPFTMTIRDEAPRLAARRNGRAGIVRLGEVTSPLREVAHVFEEVTDEKSDRYLYEVPCHTSPVPRVVPYAELCRLLKKKTFRPHAGLQEVDQQTFRSIVAASKSKTA